MPNLFIIAGCNGAGKTTASYTVLPELLQIKEFVNADEIARGLSPFQPQQVSIEAGKIMLRRIKDLIFQKKDFAFETTLSTRSFVLLLNNAKKADYTINLIYYWLDSVELAIERVKTRVSEGGHSISEEIITRRYSAGLRNFLTLYKDKINYWMFIDNSKVKAEIICEGYYNKPDQVYNFDKWNSIKSFEQK